MSKSVKKRSKKAGLPPGTLMHIGDRKTKKAEITLIDYNKEQYQEKEIKKIEECFPLRDKPAVTWININGVHDIELMEKIGEILGLHPLLLEDIMNTDQRPKMEDFGDYILIILKMIYFNEKINKIEIEQVSLILGCNFVISFQEKKGDVFDSIRERIRRGKGKMRKSGADYLAYCLLDAIVDSYFAILEGTGEKIEEMEEKLVANPIPSTLQGIHNLKRDMIFLRKSVWPLREIISGLERTESVLIEETTGIYLRDVYDHSIQVIDTIETFRDMISGMLDIYLSSISNKMNEVMKVLTIIATIFIPLTFIAGIYGMNFAYMPELQLRWGYFAALFIMAVVSIIMLFYFRKKKWL
ncbi:MAG TPA: magnesium/cobalt transporter CorA [Candidatus Atribacteria bacterium]|nr:magnesium/cobalt transporter CorA [Candidatus Atribacteria bacterium]